MSARPTTAAPAWLRSTTSRRTFALVALALAAGLLLFLALDPVDAWARVGGGQSYGGSNRSGGSSGGGGGDADLVFFLIWLCIEHPVIGIPITLIVIGVVVVKTYMGRRWGTGGVHQPARERGPGRGPRRTPTVDLRGVQRADPNFSVPAFLDFAQVVYARCHQARAGHGEQAVAAYLAQPAASALRQRSQDVSAVRDVIFGATRLVRAGVRGKQVEVVVHFESNLTEQRGQDAKQMLVTERWTFRKRAGSLSPSPSQLVAMACPGCGNPAETRPDGSCVHCDTPIGAGRVLWQVGDVTLISQEPIKPPPLALGSGDERGTRLPTVYDPMLGSQLRAFQTRYPDFQLNSFQARVRKVFLQLQAGWTEGRWEKARVLETDHLYQSHRYWMERYRRFGLRNVLEQVEVLDVTLVKLTADAFYEAITLRIKARMIDYTVDKQGNVVAGHRSKARTFTEYWTFIRTAGKPSARRGDLLHCPSCGAPLDKLSQTGVCGYCDAKIASGAHDWVLSSIEQDEAYRG